jgi:hypothetical protein
MDAKIVWDIDQGIMVQAKVIVVETPHYTVQISEDGTIQVYNLKR